MSLAVPHTIAFPAAELGGTRFLIDTSRSAAFLPSTKEDIATRNHRGKESGVIDLPDA